MTRSEWAAVCWKKDALILQTGVDFTDLEIL